MANNKSFPLRALREQLKVRRLSDECNEEGSDHINLRYFSKSPLGRLFSLEQRGYFYMPYLGRFASVMSLWAWLKDAEFSDEIRYLTGKKLADHVKENPGTKRYVPNFQVLVAYATWFKVLGDDKYVELVKSYDDTLPLLCYYTTPGVDSKGEMSYADWYIPVVREVISAVQNDRELKVGQFVTDKKFSRLNYTEGAIRAIMVHEVGVDDEELFDAKIEEMEKNLQTEIGSALQYAKRQAESNEAWRAKKAAEEASASSESQQQ